MDAATPPAPAPALAPATPPNPPGASSSALTTSEVEQKLEPVKELDWSRALVLASGAIPAGETRPVIVVERHDENGIGISGGYPADGAIYLATSGQWNEDHTGPAAHADFKVDPAKQIVVLGQDVGQGEIGGFSSSQNLLNVVPASLAYAGANLAYLQGANDIEIVGLTDVEKTALRPRVDKLMSDAGVVQPGNPSPVIREGLKITLA